MAETSVGGTTFSPQLLFDVPTRRLGWEYVYDGPPRPSPLADGQPRWSDPPPYDDAWVPGARLLARTHDPGRNVGRVVAVVLLGVALVALLVVGRAGPAALLVAALAAAAAVPLWRWVSAPERAVDQRLRRERVDHDRWLREYRASFQGAVADWQQAVRDHQRDEVARQDADRWYPVVPPAIGDAVDVFGGDPEAWAAFLATFGSGVLADGAGILVLDLTRDGVADDLLGMAADADVAVGLVALPDQLSRSDPLAGLPPDAVVEVLTGALGAGRDGDHRGQEERDTDADLLAVLVRCLDGAVSVPRLAAAARVLAGRQDGGLLSGAEVGRLVEEMDHAMRFPAARDRLGAIRVALDLLAGDTPPAPDVQPLLPSAAPGLTLVETGGPNDRRKDLLDRLLVQVLERALLDRFPTGWRSTVVLAGADGLGLEALERLACQARRSEVQLVRLFRHLRDGTERLLGAGAGATVVMRLANAQEAALAAEFIGRGHRFQLAQRTREVSRSLGDSSGGGRSSEDSAAEGRSVAGRWPGRQASVSGTRGASTGRSASWSRSVTDAWSDSTGEQRVYEYEVEPVTIQQLPGATFALVTGGPRRVVFADANPAIVAFPKVAREPLDATTPLALPSPRALPA